MKSSWGNLKVVHTIYGSYVEGRPRKKYDSANCHVKHRKKLAPYMREHTAIIMLRKHGHRINHLADCFFRSRSYIAKILATAKSRGILAVIDQRKMPDENRKICAVSSWKSLDFWMQKWMPFIKGEEGKPP